MSLEILEPELGAEQSTDFFTPKTAEEFERFRQEELAELLEPVDETELDDVKLHWRGLNPAEGFGLVHGDRPEIELVSERPNTSIDWHKAIAYNRGGEDLEYNLALGFVPEDDWEIQPAQAVISRDVAQLPGVLDYQRGNFIVNGKLHRQDVRYVVIRGHGRKSGEVGPVKVYRLRELPEQKNSQAA